MRARDLAVASARARIVLGAGAILTPALAGQVMIGRDGSRDGVKLLSRMVGARDVGLGLGVVIALDRGAPVRGWLEASALADGADLVASLVAREQIPRSSFPGLVGMAATAALLNTWLSRRLDPAPSAEPGHPEAIATGHPSARPAVGAPAE